MSPPDNKITVAISSCLLGENVRFDGNNCHAAFIIRRLGGLFSFRPICPEVAIGLGVPRDPLRLIKTNRGVRAYDVEHNNTDITDKLERFAETGTQTSPAIYGYIFKSHSPSCGIGNTKIFNESGRLIDTGGTGAYAGTVIKLLPGLPVAGENQLREPRDIDCFIEQVTRYYNARQ